MGSKHHTKGGVNSRTLVVGTRARWRAVRGYRREPGVHSASGSPVVRCSEVGPCVTVCLASCFPYPTANHRREEND